MMHEEKERLLSLFANPNAWCRGAEAVDVGGAGVAYDDDAAVAWDLSGALCRLFGWRRACVLFEQCHRHIHGRQESYGWPATDDELHAMISLQEFNDGDGTTLEVIRREIASMPVWRGRIDRSQVQMSADGAT